MLLRVGDFSSDGIGDLKCCSPEIIFPASTSQFVGVIVGEYDSIQEGCSVGSTANGSRSIPQVVDALKISVCRNPFSTQSIQCRLILIDTCSTTDQHITITTSGDTVGSGSSNQEIKPCATGQRVIAYTADQNVVSYTAIECVVTGGSKQRVVAGLTIEGVAGIVAIENVVAGTP